MYNYYLVKKNDVFKYTYLSVITLSHQGINDALYDLRTNTPLIGSDDYKMLNSYGGTIFYYNQGIFYWVINIDFPILSKECSYKYFNNKPLIDNIENIIKIIQRDLKINKIIK